jgi:hypothetical protein
MWWYHINKLANKWSVARSTVAANLSTPPANSRPEFEDIMGRGQGSKIVIRVQ